jgi:hypothetical protein
VVIFEIFPFCQNEKINSNNLIPKIIAKLFFQQKNRLIDLKRIKI